MKKAKYKTTALKRGMLPLSVLILLVLIAVVCVAVPGQLKATSGKEVKKVKNVILLMYDGQSNGAITSARWYKGKPLAIDRMNAVLCSTYMADSMISGSSESVTAYGCGNKTTAAHLSVLPTTPVTMPVVPQVPEEKKGQPVASILEGAKSVGKATGIVGTAFIQNASLAGFCSHTENRRAYEDIAEQQVYLNMDVVLGGGKAVLLPAGPTGMRRDKENLEDVLKQKGYQYVTDREQLLKADSNKLWGMFADFGMAYELDRKELHKEQPSLAEMTKKAIQTLSKDPDGFFLFVEGSKVDWAAHFNEPVGVVTDMVAFDDAVAVALEFAEKNPDTQIYVFSDHDNGGFTIGNFDTDETDDTITVEKVFGKLKKAVLTPEGIKTLLDLEKEKTKEKIVEIVGKYYGITDLSEKEIEDILKVKPRRSLMPVLGPMMNKRAFIGWTSHSHVANDVPFFYYGPVQPSGHIDNTEIAHMCAGMMGFNLAELTEKLFMEAKKEFTEAGAEVSIDETEKHNHLMVVKKGSKTVRIPFYKNIYEVGAKKYEMSGVAVYIKKTGKLYIPREAVKEIKKKLT